MIMEITRVKWQKFLKVVEKKSRMEMMLCLFLLTLIPMCYYVNVFHILPHIHQLPSLWYFVHAIPLTFVAFNLLANFVAIILTDSSVIGRLIVLPEHALDYRIVYCNICQCAVPQRSWHCDVCDVCILTRDHHCVFSTTCVGHYNRRYFLWFLLYLFVTSFYEISLIGFYVYRHVSIQFSDLLVLVPIYNIITGFHLTVGQIVVVFLAFNLVAIIMSMLLFIYHFDKVRKGLVCHEKHDNNYNFGFTQNLKTVFGEKWYITWISPFVKSKLPYDGLDWQNHNNQFKTD